MVVCWLLLNVNQFGMYAYVKECFGRVHISQIGLASFEHLVQAQLQRKNYKEVDREYSSTCIFETTFCMLVPFSQSPHDRRKMFVGKLHFA